ncbi:hypothetical protein SH528x_005306 [Novipirellula sp. SH528]|uniref:hypothetical protein n=1 Tax=Novipirellula sp. SH528 TaxID=3454466 RepID=UPI003FA08A58
MIRCSMLLLSLFVMTISLTGCGSNEGTSYDVDSAPPVTQEEIQEREDYEAQMKAEHEKQYGS